MYFGELKATKNTEHCNSATTEADWYGHIMKERLLLSLTDGKVQYMAMLRRTHISRFSYTTLCNAHNRSMAKQHKCE